MNHDSHSKRSSTASALESDQVYTIIFGVRGGSLSFDGLLAWLLQPLVAMDSHAGLQTNTTRISC